MPTQPWLKLRRLIREMKQVYPESMATGQRTKPGIDIYWDGTGLTIEICTNPEHASWRKHAHRGLNSDSHVES